MPREIEINWTTQNGPGKTTVLYFNAGVAVALQRTAIQTLLTNIVGALDTSTVASVATSGREWDSNTGALTGAWSETSVKGGTGTVSGEPVPDASQLLFQWTTSSIVNGRFLRGRSFIPGCALINVVNGNVESAIRTAIAGHANTFATSSATPVVWHRPSSGSGGTEVQMTGGTVWNEFAVLRRRRY
jgi:hypothetical protein